jgi:hypothetical protein
VLRSFKHYHDLWVTKTVCGLVNGFINHLHTPLETTSNYSAIANLHTLKITTAPAKSFSNLLVFIGHYLTTASNSGDS